MSLVKAEISISLDGFGAGPDPTREEPLGMGGERLHEWAIATESWRREHGQEGGVGGEDSRMIDESIQNVGAHVMGRKMFDGGEGPLDESWKGWWGDDPPYHTPVFVVTHHARESLEMQGGTTFHFVDGIETAVERAREAAGDGNVKVAGGASTINQCLAAGLLDELLLHIAPVVLGGGARLLVDVGDPALEPVEVVGSPAVTHVKYRVG